MAQKARTKSSFKAGMYLLETLTAGMYNDPLAIYREYIQNAADSIDIALQDNPKNMLQKYIFVNRQSYKNQKNALFMGRRVTIMIDEENFKKLRILQSKLLKQTELSVSFSKVLNETVAIGLKKSNNI